MRPDQFITHRSAPLDVLRAIAVTLVVVFHVATRYTPEDLAALDAVARWFARYGFLGVDVFYPLSGFLIVRFLSTWDGPNLGAVFFLRRFFRIVPLYILAVLVYVAASLAMGQNLDTLHNLWMTLLFLTGWAIFLVGRDLVPYTITWSISVEEFAYILLGLTALLARARLPAVLLLMFLSALLLRGSLLAQGHPQNIVYFFPPARLDSIAIGGFVALAGGRRWMLPGLLAALLLLTLGAAVSDAFRKLVLYQQVAVTAALAIAAVERYRRHLDGWLTDRVARIGFYSYFIYLFHFYPVTAFDLLADRFGDPRSLFWPVAAASLAASYALAWLSFRFFEGPLMAWGRQLEPRVAAAPR